MPDAGSQASGPVRAHLNRRTQTFYIAAPGAGTFSVPVTDANVTRLGAAADAINDRERSPGRASFDPVTGALTIPGTYEAAQIFGIDEELASAVARDINSRPVRRAPRPDIGRRGPAHAAASPAPANATVGSSRSGQVIPVPLLRDQWSGLDPSAGNGPGWAAGPSPAPVQRRAGGLIRAAARLADRIGSWLDRRRPRTGAADDAFQVSTGAAAGPSPAVPAVPPAPAGPRPDGGTAPAAQDDVTPGPADMHAQAELAAALAATTTGGPGLPVRKPGATRHQPRTRAAVRHRPGPAEASARRHAA
jgi:hypothetical protein